MKKADIGVGIGLIVLSTWLFFYAQGYAQAAIYYYGPNFFPQFLALAMTACAVVLIIKGLKGRSLAAEERIDPRGFLRMLIAIAMCLGYLILMQVIGFTFGTMVFLFFLMTFLKQEGLGKRTFASVLASLVVWAIFTYFLIIPLPTGMFSFTF